MSSLGTTRLDPERITGNTEVWWDRVEMSVLPTIHSEWDQVASSAVFAGEWRNLIHIEIPPDDEVSRVSRADFFQEHIG
jgi:hypothetical protein